MQFFILPPGYQIFTVFSINACQTESSSPTPDIGIFQSNYYSCPATFSSSVYSHESHWLASQNELQQQQLQNQPPISHISSLSSNTSLLKQENKTVKNKVNTREAKTPAIKLESQLDQLPIKTVERHKISNKRENLRMQQDDDLQYLPELQRKKTTNITYQQNQNRNIIPNEINQIISFILKKTKSGHMIQKLFSKYPHPDGYSPKRFYLYQSQLKNKIGHYTNARSLKYVTELYEPKCEIWCENEQRFYNKLCRVLIRHFLHQESIFMILTSKRMKKEKKASHLHARRKVTQQVMKIISGG